MTLDQETRKRMGELVSENKALKEENKTLKERVKELESTGGAR